MQLNASPGFTGRYRSKGLARSSSIRAGMPGTCT
jgi:hypothetical protein